MKTNNQIISSNIWNLSQEAMDLQNALIESEGELTPEIEEGLERFNTSTEGLVEVVGGICRKYSSDIDVIDAEIKRLQDLKTRRRKASDSLKDKLFRFMQDNGIERVEIGTTTARIQKGREKVVCSEDMELKPYEERLAEMQKTLPPYVKLKMELGKTELKKWIEDKKPTISAIITREPTLNLK